MHPLLQNLHSKEAFFKLVNRFSLDVISYEEALADYKGVQSHTLRSYFDTVNELKENIQNYGNTKGYLRLGFGKMQFYQTIALTLFKQKGSNEYNEHWIKYLRYCNGNIDETIPAIFPSTRFLTTLGQQPLGWVELS
jgi:CRISPR/Cas system CSM-associated protein Csm5 (group 7 of RAMP superfamily)